MAGFQRETVSISRDVELGRAISLLKNLTDGRGVHPTVLCLGFGTIAQAISFDVEEVPTRVFSAEYLTCIALETGHPKDKARLLQFMETGTHQDCYASVVCSEDSTHPT